MDNKEKELLLLKSVSCPICDKTFRSIQVKSGRARRKEPDLDLRPRFDHIDTNKYDIASCPHCGYTAMHRYFTSLSSLQMKLVKEGFCNKLKNPPMQEITELKCYTYDEVIGLFKIALYITELKKGKASEKAYECLKIAWLLKGKIEELEEDKEKNQDAILNAQKEYLNYYTQAFDGLVNAMASERYPICGMDQNTMDLLIAAMAFHLEKYEYSARFVSGLLISKTASSNIKKRAYELKEMIVEKIKK